VGRSTQRVVAGAENILRVHGALHSLDSGEAWPIIKLRVECSANLSNAMMMGYSAPGVHYRPLELQVDLFEQLRGLRLTAVEVAVSEVDADPGVILLRDPRRNEWRANEAMLLVLELRLRLCRFDDVINTVPIAARLKGLALNPLLRHEVSDVGYRHGDVVTRTAVLFAATHAAVLLCERRCGHDLCVDLLRAAAIATESDRLEPSSQEIVCLPACCRDLYTRVA
jgi:hypothetical protein